MKMANNKKKFLFAVIFALSALMAGIFYNYQTVYAQAAGFKSGEVTNIVVFVRFSDSSSDFVTSEYASTMNLMYNTSPTSVKSYFKSVSENSLTVNTVFGKPKNQTEVCSVQLANPRKYYRAKSGSNTIGYDTGNYYDMDAGKNLPSGDSFYREQLMVREVIDALDLTQFQGKNLDCNNDGKVDSICFIVEGAEETWDALLWPHMTSLFDFRTYGFPSNYSDYGISRQTAKEGKKYINGDLVENYNFFPSGYITKTEIYDSNSNKLYNVGVLCHELMHTFGAMDLYHYNNSVRDVSAVGETDIMDKTHTVPQYPLVYTRQRLGWIDDAQIVTIESSGDNYTLTPVTSNGAVKAYKIHLQNFNVNTYELMDEYFMIEYRVSATTGKFDSLLSGSGLVIYRIDEESGYINSSGDLGSDYYGNMYGPPDEVYVFRRNDSSTISGGNCFISTEFGKTETSATKTQNAIFYSDGKNSGIKIIVNSMTSGEISFSVELPQDPLGVRLYKENTGYNDVNKEVTFKTSKDCKIKYMVLEKGSPAPDLNEVNNPVNYTASTILLKGETTAFGDVLSSISVKELTKSGKYDIYMVLSSAVEDGTDDNLQSYSFTYTVGKVVEVKNCGKFNVVAMKDFAYLFIALSVIPIVLRKRA